MYLKNKCLYIYAISCHLWLQYLVPETTWRKRGLRNAVDSLPVGPCRQHDKKRRKHLKALMQNMCVRTVKHHSKTTQKILICCRTTRRAALKFTEFVYYCINSTAAFANSMNQQSQTRTAAAQPPMIWRTLKARGSFATTKKMPRGSRGIDVSNTQHRFTVAHNTCEF